MPPRRRGRLRTRAKQRKIQTTTKTNNIKLMKNNILKSIFLTILLLLGVSHAANAAWTFNKGDVFYIDMSAITEENFGCNIFAGQGSKYSAEIVSGSATRDGDASDYFKECKAPIIKVTFNQDNTSIDANTIVVKTSKGGWAGNLTCQKLGSNITNNCLKVNSDGKTGSLTTYGAGEYDASPTTAPTCSSNSTPSEGSSWYDITNNPYIYFNNTYANYGIVAVLLGRKENYENNNSVPTGSESINMSKIENTNLFYVQKQSWNHFTTFLFIQENGWSWEGNTVTNRINSTSNYTNTYNVSMNGGYHMFTASCGSNGANLSYANSNSHTDLLHKKQNVLHTSSLKHLIRMYNNYHN